MDLPIPTTAKAKLVSLGPDQTELEVQFNPTSLVYTLENTTKQQSATPKRKQFAAQFSARLSMDLQFDTTTTGEDVRTYTNQIALFMQPSNDVSTNPDGTNPQAQPVVSFQWGSYQFNGTLDSFKETIDFFSADGVPLRAMVSIGMSQQDQVLDTAGSTSNSVQGSLLPSSGNLSLTALATLGGDPTAARQLGSVNSIESLRFTGGASLQVNAGIQLNAAAGFSAPASAGAGLSTGSGAGAGVSIGGGASFGATAGVASSASLQMSAGAGGGALFGGQASAGVPAAAGAFAGLETGRATVSSTARLDPLRMLPSTSSADVSTGANTSFSLGGAALAGSGFASDVGAQFSFNDRLVFDNE
jgi:hypothetical protein